MISAAYSYWQTELFLTTIQQLEQRYTSSRQACVALSISRQYRQLCSYVEHDQRREQWLLQTKLWWQRYCLAIKHVSPASLTYSVLENLTFNHQE